MLPPNSVMKGRNGGQMTRVNRGPMTSQPESPIPRMDWLDYARLVCALWVMLDHFMVTALDPRVGHGISSYGLATEIARFGTVALFVFMMTSGLVITLVAQRQPASVFVTNRFARVYPTFLVCMLITAVLSPLGPPRFYDSWAQVLANLLIYAPAFGYRYVDTVYWTLVIEINFYAAVTVLILTGAIQRIQLVVTVWIALQVLACLAGLHVPLFGYKYYFVSAGAVMALLYQRRNETFNFALLGVSLLLCIYAATIYARAWRFNEVGSALLTVAIFALFLFMRNRRVTLPWAQRIGSMTYPLYLLHFSLGLTVFYWWINEANKWLLVLAASVLLIAISFVIDDVMEFRLRPLWKRIAAATIARPFAWWEARASGRREAKAAISSQ